MSKLKRIAYAAFGAVALLVLAFAGVLIPGGWWFALILEVSVPCAYLLRLVGLNNADIMSLAVPITWFLILFVACFLILGRIGSNRSPPKDAPSH
jgi:hypothetical protein